MKTIVVQPSNDEELKMLKEIFAKEPYKNRVLSVSVSHFTFTNFIVYKK